MTKDIVMAKDIEEQVFQEVGETVHLDLASPETICAWWEDGRSMDASHWWSLKSVTPEEAAKLLCRMNPSADIDPKTFATDKTGPQDYERLLRQFQDTTPTERRGFSLQQWLELAKNRKLNYHPWIDEWRKARNAVAANSGGNASETADLNPPQYKSKQQLQEEKILAWLRANYGDPQHLPCAQNGKPGPKSVARHALMAEKSVFLSKIAFDKAWERLRASREIQDAIQD